MGLDDRGEGFAGRYGLDAVKVGRALAEASLSRKTGRGIVLNMVWFFLRGEGRQSCIRLGEWIERRRIESGCYDIVGE